MNPPTAARRRNQFAFSLSSQDSLQASSFTNSIFPYPESSMSELACQKLHFVLIHGVGHGAWCWYKVGTQLKSSGYKVTCLDLRSAGIDRSDPNSILTLEDYDAPLINFMSNLPENEKVVLVGHSGGGLSVTDAIYRFTEKIEVAVYVAANMLKHGMSAPQDFADGVPDLSEYGDVSICEYGLGPEQPPTSSVIRTEFQRQILYNLSPEEDSTLASLLVRPAPLVALGSARFSGGGSEVDRVPRVYIKTMLDGCVKVRNQEAMIRRWPPVKVLEMESDHSPFFSNPTQLVNLILQAAAMVGVGYTCQ